MKRVKITEEQYSGFLKQYEKNNTAQELSKAIQTIQYDGGYSYTFDTSINNNNNDWNYEET